MGSLFYYVSFVNYQYIICTLNGRKSMGNDKASLVLHKLSHRLLNLDFCSGVYIGGSLIEYKHLGIEKHGSCYSKKLLLTLGNIHPLLVNNGVIPIRQTSDIR